MSLNTTPDSYTKLLIHSDTSDGSTTFVDSSANGHIISTAGDPTHEDTQKKFGATSMYFDGNDYLTIPDHADWDLGTGNFTCDVWVFITAFTSYPNIFNQNGANWAVYFNNSTKNITVVLESNAYNFSWSPSISTWYHMAIVRSGTSLKAYIDGVPVGSTLTASDDVSGTSTLYIGSNPTPGDYWNGYMDEVRISKGIARWTNNFTPPTRPYSIIDDQFHTDIDTISDREIVVGGVDSFTKLLIHSDDIDGGTTFVDSIPSGSHTITSIQVSHSIDYKKFGNSSMEFNGTSDYFTVPASSDFGIAATDDWTFDCWTYYTGQTGYADYIFNVETSGDVMNFSVDDGTGGLEFYMFHGGLTTMESDGRPIEDEWVHLALVQQGSGGKNIINMYVNGVKQAGSSVANALGGASTTLYIGSHNTVAHFWHGYMDEIRWSKGIARWTNSFVPPTRQYGDKTVISAEGGVGIGTNIAREAFHVNSGQRRLYSVTADTTGSLFSVNDKNGNPLLDVNSEGFVTKPKQPAFLVTPSTSQNNMTQNGRVVIAFATTIFDQDNNFSTPNFTAPVTGKYQLSCIVRVDQLDIDNAYHEVRIVTTNRTYVKFYSKDDTDSLYYTFPISILVDMDVGDTAYIDFYSDGTGGGSIADMQEGSTYFSGYLVC